MKIHYSFNFFRLRWLTPQAGLFLLVLLLGSVEAWAQAAPANDDPCGAVVLTPSGQLCLAPTLGTTQGATTTTPNGYSNLTSCGTTYGSPRDVWYKFTTTASGLGSTGATITAVGNAAGQLRLFSAASCTAAFTEIQCQAAASNTAAPALSTTALTANTTYYVRVGTDYFTNPGPFTLCVTDGPGSVTCTPQLTLTGPAYTNPDNTAATFSFSTSSNYALPYTVTVQEGPGLSLGGSPPQVFTTTTSPITLTGLLVGHSYSVTVQAFCTSGGQTLDNVTFYVRSPNDEPCGAYPLTLSPGPVCVPRHGALTGATATAPNGYPADGCGGPPRSGGVAFPDVWYTFMTAPSGPASTSAVITISNMLGAGQLRLFAAATCAGPFAEVGCSTTPVGQTGGASPLVATNLLPNTRYYVSVTPTSSGPTTDGFDICASAVAPVLPCPQPTLTVGLIQTNAAGLGIQLPLGTPLPPTYTITYTPAGGSPTTITLVATPYDFNSPTSVFTFLRGLLPNTTYTVSVVANCAPGQQSTPGTVTFTTLPGAVVTPVPAPANDECATAQLLPVTSTCVPVATTNVGATASANPIAANCVGSAPDNDVWYRFLMPASGTAEVRLDSVAGSPLRDVVMSLYLGTCGALTPLDCNLRVRANNVLRVAAAPGTPVLVRVFGAGSQAHIFGTAGAFTICVTDAAPPCAIVTNVVLSNITTTSVTVTFNWTPTGSTGFIQVVARPVGSGQLAVASTRTGTATLTGLTPGTAYVLTLQNLCTSQSSSPQVQVPFSTLALPPVCAPPAGLYVGNVGSTTATVSFYLTPGATSHVLTYTAAGGTPQTLTVTASPVALTNLLPNTRYTVSLQATCSFGAAVPATTAFTTTNGCPVPLFVAVSAISTTAATISFTAPAGATGYYVLLAPAGGAPVQVLPAPTTSPFTLTGLTPGTGYTVYLGSSCAGGLLSTNAEVRFVTLLPVATCTAPTAVAVTGVLGTSASVRFTGPAGAVSYTATATPTAGGAAVVVSGPASPLLLTGLQPGTAYTVTVLTNCGAGTASAASSATAFATLLAARNAALAAAVGLFPNPAHHSVTLTVPVALLRQASLLTISDVLGRTVRQRYVTPSTGTTADTRAELDLTGLPTGIYLLRLFSNVGPLTKRLVIE